MDRKRLPAFMVIGAVKAATTWIAHQLRCHPRLWLPMAEPHYFSSEYDRGLDWYGSLFAAAPEGRLIGEKSADYLAHPDAAARIAKTLPGIPLIAQLRDPVDRAYSDYCMLFRRGMVGSDPRRCLSSGNRADTRFLEGGRYAHHIRRLRHYIPASRLKVILYEDIRRNPTSVITDICEHIGVETHIVADAVLDRHNDSRTPILPLAMRRILRPVRPLLDPLRTHPWLTKIRDTMAQPIEYPPLTDELRHMLREYYRDDTRDLEDLINRDLGSWLSTPPVPHLTKV